MTESATHCESRKWSYRQTKEGVVVSFLLHPNEVPDDLATSPIGTRYMLALAQIGEDEKALPPTTKKRSASQRAFLIGRKTDFQIWVGQQTGQLGQTEETCAAFIKTRCGVLSRAQLDTNTDARLKFEMMEAQYQADNGLAPSPERR